MVTLARPYSEQASHYYWPTGEPAYTVPKATGVGDRPTTVRDARKLGLLPSVTTILSILNKKGLELWKTENACLAVLTSPRHPAEELDAFVRRVLHTERVQDEESRIARNRGTEIHSALEDLFDVKGCSDGLWDWVGPAFNAINQVGSCQDPERVLVGDGYAGKTDLVQGWQREVTIWDFKTCKELPDKPWPEHILQLSAYAAALARTTDKPIQTANCYISTTKQGQFKIHRHEQPWIETYVGGFRPLVKHWRWANRMPAGTHQAGRDAERMGSE